MTPRISISVTRSISRRGGGRADGATRLATIISRLGGIQLEVIGGGPLLCSSQFLISCTVRLIEEGMMILILITKIIIIIINNIFDNLTH